LAIPTDSPSSIQKAALIAAVRSEIDAKMSTPRPTPVRAIEVVRAPRNGSARKASGYGCHRTEE